MAMDWELVEELCARNEGQDLDFKQSDYDWAGKRRHEFAKDLIAMANSLSPGQSPAHILIGVVEQADRTGKPVGLPDTDHLDDADIHTKVRTMLNRTPRFSYTLVPHPDKPGHSVGVYQIQPGGRPYYPLKDIVYKNKVKLRRFLPLYRNGSRNDDASPQMVIEWAREDNPVARHVLALQHESLEAELTPQPRLEGRARIRGPQYCKIDAKVTNHGSHSFDIADLAYVLVRSDGVEGTRHQFERSTVALRAGTRADFDETIQWATAAELIPGAKPGKDAWATLTCRVFVRVESRGRIGEDEVEFSCG